MRDPILLVEADDERRSVHRDALERAGYPVVEARTGEEAIWTVHRDRPCAIIMECSVPGVTGLRAAEVLKEEPGLREIPVVLLASSGDAEEEQRAYGARCDVYVAEPGHADAVLEAVRWVTGSEHRRAERQTR